MYNPPQTARKRKTDRVGIAGVPEDEEVCRKVRHLEERSAVHSRYSHPSPQYFSIKPAVSVESQHPRKHLPVVDFAIRRVNSCKADLR